MGARAKSCPLHWPRNYPKKCKLSRFDETQVKRRKFSTIFAIAWKIEGKQPGEEKTLVLRLLYKILGGGWISGWVTGEHILTFDSSCHLPMSWLREEGGGVLVLRGQGSWARGFCVWPPTLTLHCHNYNLLNISQSENSYNWGGMVITPLCRLDALTSVISWWPWR